MFTKSIEVNDLYVLDFLNLLAFWRSLFLLSLFLFLSLNPPPPPMSGIIISDLRRGCFMGFREFIFFFFFPRRDLVRAISLEPSLVETPDSVCCLVLQSNFALLLTIQFASLFFLIFFFLFFCQDFVRPISLESLLAETPN